MAKIINPFTDVDEGNAPRNDQSQEGFLDNVKRLTIGAGDKGFRATTEGMWLGAEKFADAPFSVDPDGNVVGAGGGLKTHFASGSRTADGNFSVTGLSFEPQAVIAIGFSNAVSGAKATGFARKNGSGADYRTISQNNDNLYGALLYVADAADTQWSNITVSAFNADSVDFNSNSGSTSAYTLFYAFLILG